MKIIQCLFVCLIAFNGVMHAQTCPSCTGSQAAVEDSAAGIVAPDPYWKFGSANTLTGNTLAGQPGSILYVPEIVEGAQVPQPGGVFTGPAIQNASQLYITGQSTIPTVPATTSGAPYYPGTTTVINGVCSGAACAPALPVGYPGLTVFGDSAGCGNTAQPVPGVASAQPFFSPLGFAWLLAADFGGVFTNYCNGGDWSEDLVREQVMPFVAPTDSRNPTYLIETGGDDAIDCSAFLSGSPACVTAYTQAVQAAVAWLAIPPSCKVLGQQTGAGAGGAGTGIGCGPSGPPQYAPAGAWGPDNFYSNGGYNRVNLSPPLVTPLQVPNIAEFTASSGATITIPITTLVPMQNAYCGWRVQFSPANSSSATLQIDGNTLDTWQSFFNLGGSPYTANSSQDTVFVRYYPIALAGPHTLLITANASAGNFFSFAWCGVAPQPVPVPNPQATQLSLTSSAAASGGTTAYTGAITGGAGNALVGKWFFVSGFSAGSTVGDKNNGAFLCVGSTATTLTLLNNAGIAETASAAAKPGVTLPAFQAGLPRVILTGLPRLPDMGSSGYVVPDSYSLMFDNSAQQVATAFAQDGLQVSLAQLRTYLTTTPITDPSNPPYGGDWSYGGLHPSAQGHQHIRDAVEAAVINSFYQSRAYAPVSRSCGSFTTTANTADNYLCPTVTQASRCYLQPTNSTASGLLSGTYISTKVAGLLVIAHPATAGGTFDIVCTQN